MFFKFRGCQMKSFSYYRRRAGLSVKEVGELLKVSVETAAEYERGARFPTAREIQILKGMALSQPINPVMARITEWNSIRHQNDGPKKRHMTIKGFDWMSDLEAVERPAKNTVAYSIGHMSSKATDTTNSELTFYEFFCGGGMVSAGLGPNWKCLFANDFDSKKSASYKKNWADNTLVTKDVAGIEPHELPGTARLAWASFPCQDLSLAGMGAGLRGDRSGTFWPFWRLVQKLKAEDRAPRLIVLENVCGTLTSHAGSDFIAIADALSAESYRFGAIVVDAIGFVPQSRPRLFIIAAADGVIVPPNLVTADATVLWHPRALQIAQLRLKGKSKDNWVWWKLPAPPRRKTRFADVIEENPKSVSWHTTAETAKLLSMMNDVNLDKVRAAQKTGQRMVGGIYKRTRLDDDDQKVQRAEVRFDDVAGCLRTSTGGSSRQYIIVVNGDSVRSRLLSSREAARLMGLPERYELPNSYNEAYHLIGDGVAVPVVRHLAQHVFETILVNNAVSHSSLDTDDHFVQKKRAFKRASRPVS
jgi:DNA (cytosine-5)-methyltransferase 1